jgi:hypothetical protein
MPTSKKFDSAENLITFVGERPWRIKTSVREATTNSTCKVSRQVIMGTGYPLMCIEELAKN